MANTGAKKKTEQTAISEATELIKSRRPLKPERGATFRLKGLFMIHVKPRFTYVSPSGKKELVRYSKNENSIFVSEQVGYDEDTGSKNHTIVLNKNTNITDPLLRDFLLLHPHYGRYWELYDPEREYKNKLALIDAFDDVWFKVKDLSVSEMRALLYFMSPSPYISVDTMDKAELKVSLRNITEANPTAMKNALSNPRVKNLYLYHLGTSLKELMYDEHSGEIKWASSGKAICKVPASQKPGMYFAELVSTQEYADVLVELEKRLYD